MDIKAVILAADVDENDIEDDSITDCAHFYVYFRNGRIISVMRGSHPMGRVLGDPSMGDVEAAVLKFTLVGPRPTGEGVHKNLNAEGLTELIERVKAMPELTLEEMFEGSMQIL